MPLKKLEEIQNGEVAEFIQLYIDGEPHIFYRKFGHKNTLEESYFFLKDVLDSLNIDYEKISEESMIPKLEGKDYSYEGFGRVAKDNGIVRIWNSPGYCYNKRHLIKYHGRFPNVGFDKHIQDE